MLKADVRGEDSLMGTKTRDDSMILKVILGFPFGAYGNDVLPRLWVEKMGR
jgi:hypothetical protein